jgi:hypothetical protein
MAENTKVVSQEDLDANPVLGELGAAVGDSVSVAKAPGGDNSSGTGEQA